MQIIVPMAGRGPRLRPHSLSTPKPLNPVAGIPIVHQLGKAIAQVVKDPITDIGFVLGDLTMGQLLCIPMIILGTLILLRKENETIS